jgi:hypothetical protein
VVTQSANGHGNELGKKKRWPRTRTTENITAPLISDGVSDARYIAIKHSIGKPIRAMSKKIESGKGYAINRAENRRQPMQRGSN